MPCSLRVGDGNASWSGGLFVASASGCLFIQAGIRSGEQKTYTAAGWAHAGHYGGAPVLLCNTVGRIQIMALSSPKSSRVLQRERAGSQHAPLFISLLRGLVIDSCAAHPFCTWHTDVMRSGNASMWALSSRCRALSRIISSASSIRDLPSAGVRTRACIEFREWLFRASRLRLREGVRRQFSAR